MSELEHVIPPPRDAARESDKFDCKSLGIAAVPMQDYASLKKSSDAGNAACAAALPPMAIVGDLAEKKAAALKPAPIIEVPPSDELDSPDWHKHPEHRKAPGEFFPPLTPRIPGDPRVASILQNMSGESMKNTIAEISGEKEVVIDGKKVKLDSRSTFGDGYKQALQYFKERFEKEGYSVTVDTYSRWGKEYQNLRAVKLGQAKPNEVVMYGAHIDSTAGEPWEFEPKAPGADDDGSGSAALLEIAKGIKNLPLDRTVVFSMFSGEEEGLWGSRAMAELYKKSQAGVAKDLEAAGVAPNDGLGKIVGMYQMDMIGYAKDNTVESHDTTSNVANHKMTDLLHSTQQRYNIDLKVFGAHNEELTNRSDHYPFQRLGIPAVLVIEPYSSSDNFNPYYHSTQDTLDKINVPYMTNVARLVAAAGVELAGLRPAAK